jgi:hypothetical protein
MGMQHLGCCAPLVASVAALRPVRASVGKAVLTPRCEEHVVVPASRHRPNKLGTSALCRLHFSSALGHLGLLRAARSPRVKMRHMPHQALTAETSQPTAGNSRPWRTLCSPVPFPYGFPGWRTSQRYLQCPTQTPCRGALARGFCSAEAAWVGRDQGSRNSTPLGTPQ